jgi:hypothetical protein
VTATLNREGAASDVAHGGLSESHRQLLEASGISADVSAARGYRTLTSRAELGRLGFGRSQQRTPALLIPIWNVNGEIGSYQIRPDEPRIRDGKPIKQQQTAPASVAAWITSARPARAPPGIRPR